MRPTPKTTEEYIARRIASSRIVRRLRRHMASDKRLSHISAAKRALASEWTVAQLLAREG